MSNKKCLNCDYFDKYDDAPELSETWNENDTIGECKRYPPVLVHEYHGLANDFGCPSVRSSDFCGEFTARETVGASIPVAIEKSL